MMIFFEPVIETIKDMVAQMPEETHAVDAMVAEVIPNVVIEKNELEELVADFQEMPVFEPITEANKRKTNKEKKSLNDKLKNSDFTIGLNDKLAFIKHLFDGKNEEYERVISQISTSQTYEEANTLIQNIIKPDYNHWEGKTEFEERFMEIIESKFN